MDDQQTYLLNGLLTRNFGLGRIVRFRQVARGRQAQTFEVLTHQQHEYTVYLYPPTFAPEQLNFAAGAINLLDKHRFSVVPMLAGKASEREGGGEEGLFTAEGPQGAAMLVSLTTTGSALTPDQYTQHDLSQLALRLAWLHRLLGEQLPAPRQASTLVARLAELLDNLSPDTLRHLPPIPVEARRNLLSMLVLQTPQGWAHGDIQPAALLVDSDHQLRTLVDFGLLHHGSPLEDVIDALLSFCIDPAGNVQIARAKVLLESYDSLRPLKNLPLTPIVAGWLAQRLLDAAGGRRPLPKSFSKFLTNPENLATAIASCR